VAQVFIDLGDTNTPRYHHAATLLQNGQVLITGGETDPTPSGAYNNAELFNPTTWTFSPLSGNMTSGREGHAATLLNDGTVLITGGDLAPSGSLNTAEIFNPTSSTFTPASAAMTSPRIFHDSVLLNGGQVLLSGGENDSNGASAALSSAELYNPTTQTFTATPGNMISVREHQTATLLNDGTVLEDGGTDGTNVFNTAEIYTTSQLTGLISIAIFARVAIDSPWKPTALSRDWDIQRRQHASPIIRVVEFLLFGSLRGH
jgi:Galactose oxidase, central domain